MLRPERMSRVSVTGAKRVLDDVIETVHDLNLVHVTDYDGAWEGFEPGDPIAGADEAAERLVTVRALQSILDLDPDSVDTEARTEVDVDERLERVRREVNELDDRRDELQEERRAVEERTDSMSLLETLGIDLDLLWGYESLETRVGEGSEEAIREALDATDDVESYEIFSEDDAIAAFARPVSGADDVLEDTLVGAEFTAIDVPEAEGTPAEYVADLEERRRELEADISEVETELDDLRDEHGEFLSAAEEQLAIEVEKREAPLSFATTRNAFVAEGWIPTDRYDDLAAGLEASVGEHVELEELERASYDGDGQVAEREPTESGETGSGEPEPAADGGSEDERIRADGGETPMSGREPPVVQQNPDPVKPFEILTRAVGQPNYSELDPTVIVTLTLPAFFGFMIGDVGYGLVYLAIGYFLYSRYDSDAFVNIGIITMASGFFTVVFGVLFGEIFGVPLVRTYFWEPLIGGAPLYKGLYPANVEWAKAWFVIAALVGIFHLFVGYVFQFVEDFELHGLKDAMLETGSWLLALVGFWLFVFSRFLAGSKPPLLYEVFNRGSGAAFALGFSGFPVWVGYLGVAMLGVGFALLALGPTYELIEFHTVLAHPLSYLRLSAELLAEVGLAFAVNLLFFGAYQSEGEFHFMLTHGSEYVLAHHEHAQIMFPGLVHGGIISIIGGILVLIAGHLIVLALGVMSVGIQAIRLEYFEFFSKFYDGGGIPYSPFGRDRRFTTEE